MIKDFDLHIGTAFVFGRDAERRVGGELAARGVRRVLIHHDGGAYLEASGLLEAVRHSLDDAGLTHVELGGVQPNPRLGLVREGIALAHSERVDAIVAIGGGSVIDSAKAIGIGAVAGDGVDVWDFFTGAARPTRTLPVAVVLTLPASGSESSKVVVVNNEDEHRKMLVSLPVVRPELAFMNPALTVSVPAYPTACGIVDMFSHVCERYFSDDCDWGVADRMCEGVLRTLVDVGPRCMADPASYALRAEIMWISTIAQNNTLSIGRDEDWSTHVIGNEISALYDTAHGATLSIVMGSWMRVAAERAPLRFARYAHEVFGLGPADWESQSDGTGGGAHGQGCADRMGAARDLAHAGIAATEAFFRSLDMPVGFADAGLAPSDADIETMLDQIAFYGDDRAIGAVARLDRDDCRRVLRMAAGALTDGGAATGAGETAGAGVADMNRAQCEDGGKEMER